MINDPVKILKVSVHVISGEELLPNPKTKAYFFHKEQRKQTHIQTQDQVCDS